MLSRIISNNALFLLVFVILVFQNNHFQDEKFDSNRGLNQDASKYIIVDKDVSIKEYFLYVDSIATRFNEFHSYDLNEHLLVRHNPWIIDTLANTDYYRMIQRDSFVYDQKELLVLRQYDTIRIPDSIQVLNLKNVFNKTRIDVNIPEYKLRVYEDSLLLYQFSVRVGRNESKYLEMAGRIENLKTKTGKGTIVKHERAPDYYNPVNGHQYHFTKRDDDRTTKLPQIPFIETEINGLRYGQLIHPTTNPVTLGKAYSNGCIGTNESDAWVIYYHTPIGTTITIRYDLNILDEEGNSSTLKDIYN